MSATNVVPLIEMDELLRLIETNRHPTLFSAFLIVNFVLPDLPDQKTAPAEEIVLTHFIAYFLKTNLSQTFYMTELAPQRLIIFMPELQNETRIKQAAQEILEQFESSVSFSGRTFNLTAKIGYACAPTDGTTYSALLEHASFALQRVQQTHGRDHMGYQEAQTPPEKAFAEITRELEVALKENQLMLYFQPIFLLNSMKIDALETLLRWKHPTMGFIPASKFIPAANESGLIVPIGQWIVKELCKQLTEWQNQKINPPRVYMNISAEQFQHPEFLESFTDTLEKTKISPHLIGIELTDTSLMRDIEMMTKLLHELSIMGIRIAIDDFGGGFSSLQMFETLPIHLVKIDRCYTKNILRNQGDTTLVESIITLTEAFAIDVICEGIETPEQLEFLNNAHCSKGQGYLLCRPLTAEGTQRLLTKVNEPLETIPCDNDPNKMF